uniref:Uncharacterized protein n=1 Tax=viral metagenome TaxID=1070528 RepID=A0A6C0J4A6_9ZZZZ
MGDTPSKQSDEYISNIPLILEENNKKAKKNNIKEKVIVEDKLEDKFKYKVVVYDDK